MGRAESGTLDPAKDRSCRGYYTPKEIAALRADPSCVMPNRNLAAQWRYCRRNGIPRDPSLRVSYKTDLEKAANRAPRCPEERAAANHRWYFRRRVRANPGPVLDELRRLAGRHHLAEDLVVEAFATMLRLAVPAIEAFRMAKTEVNRTSAQPFREQSFNPNIDYGARETGRQVSRASDIRAARGDG